MRAAHRSATDGDEHEEAVDQVETTTRDAITLPRTRGDDGEAEDERERECEHHRPAAGQSLSAPSAGRLANSSAAPMAVHAERLGHRSGCESVAASTPGSACVVTAFTEIRQKSAR